MEDCVRRDWDSCLDCNNVVGFINSNTSTEETRKEFVVAMLTRLKYISESIVCCHRIDLELSAEPTDGGIEPSEVR